MWVSDAQMRALFGEGRHPNRDERERTVAATGATAAEVDRASRLGSPYLLYSATNEFRQRCAVAFRESNTDQGRSWDAPVPVEDRARIRTAIAIDLFEQTHGRLPADPRELSGHLARLSRQPTTAVAGYDLAFSPVKSVSTLWAIAPPAIARVIEEAHADAVADVVTWLEDHAVFSRTGRHGVAQVDVHGVIAASFTHRDSRAGDPDLHTHVAVSNKVQALDGRWLALDGRFIYKNNVAASERYNTRIETLLVERLGVRFMDCQPTEPGKRPVREIVGIDGPLPRVWSSRRAAIDARRATLSAAFQADHGRPPTAQEAIHLAQQANLETRQAKHEPRTRREQRATWRAEALSVLGGEQQLADYVGTALRRRRGSGSRGPDVTESWLVTEAIAVIERVELSRATWDVTHLRAEAERRVRRTGVPSSELDAVVDGVVARASAHPTSRRLTSAPDDGEPPALRRQNGTSVFEVADSAVFSSDLVLRAERTVLDAAARFDGHVTPASAIDTALMSASSTGPALNSGQEQFVRALASSGARVQVATAPAGTGKTTALRVLAAAWRAGGGTVIGLAPSAAASSVLREQLADTTDTVAKFVHSTRTGVGATDWLASLGAGSLVIVDEVGAAATQDLASVVTAVMAAGGSVRLVGDDQQLGPIGAGGLLRDLAKSGGAVQLDQVVRFTHPGDGSPNIVEGAVSLALRDGDAAALAYYADRGRLHVGDLSTCTDQAYDAWSADRDAGRDSLMLAPSRDLVRELNLRAQAERLSREGTARPREAQRGDGTTASVGDVIISRRNNRALGSGASWVTNGDRWTVASVQASGALDVVHMTTAAVVTLPADYVSNHVTLGYATTVHGAQGVTADSSYTVISGAESRQLLYVALTRGRHTNHAYVAVTGDGDAHSAITRDGLLPPTAIEILERVLARDDAPRSATRVAREDTDPVQQLGTEVDRYVHALATAAQQHTGTEGMAAIDKAAEAASPGLTTEPAYPALRADLALQVVAGHDAVGLLRDAVDDPRGLRNARDLAAVLDWRIGAPEPDGPARPLPWLPAVPRGLNDHPVWGSYLSRRASRVQELAATVSDDAVEWTPHSAPPWSQALLGEPDLVRDLAVWRAVAGVEPSDPRPTGAPSTIAADVAHQRRLDERVRRTLSAATTEAVRWAAQLRGAAPGITDDPYWPVLLDRLVDSRISDADGARLLDAATSTPLPDELPASALWWRLVEHLPVRRHGETDQSAQVDMSPEVAPVTLAKAPCEPARRRALEINQLAAKFFAAAYTGSWAQSYLVERLGTDPKESTNHTIGYAPHGWTTLVNHLRGSGVSDDDLMASGLASRASNGRLIDRFRDRVVFAIRADDGIVGWIGRRHPDLDRTPHQASPKYLNTAETAAFVKGRHLFGLEDNQATLQQGATAVLVEGPLDALAVTVAGAGEFVGVAPLGTAFTGAQAEQLMLCDPVVRPSVIVGMDSDTAGRRSAESIFWRLSDRADVRSLLLPDGGDPADVLREGGPVALASALDSSTGLAGVLVDARIDDLACQLGTVEGQVAATRRSAEVIAATPVPQWPALLTHVVARTGIAPDIALAETLAAADLRADKKRGGDALVDRGANEPRILKPSRQMVRAPRNHQPQPPAPAGQRGR
jgi:DNA primase catalytic core